MIRFRLHRSSTHGFNRYSGFVTILEHHRIIKPHEYTRTQQKDFPKIYNKLVSQLLTLKLIALSSQWVLNISKASQIMRTTQLKSILKSMLCFKKASKSAKIHKKKAKKCRHHHESMNLLSKQSLNNSKQYNQKMMTLLGEVSHLSLLR